MVKDQSKERRWELETYMHPIQDPRNVEGNCYNRKRRNGH